MAGLYIIFKTIDGKKNYWSATGRWIKTTPGAAVMSRDAAQEKARTMGGSIRAYSFRG